MELKWLEDFVSVVEKGHFARAATDRNITQSALSRRIRSLETWVGAELLDRSEHPIGLTPAGEDFIQTAREIIAESYKARKHATAYSRIAETGVTIACLHTLALFYVPSLITSLRTQVGPFETSVIADTRTVDEYLESLFSGSADLFICYTQPRAPFKINESDFPKLDIGIEKIRPYQLESRKAVSLSVDASEPIPYLEYASTSFMSRVVQDIVDNSHFRSRLKPVYRATLAESLASAALHGLGVGWLPDSLMTNDPRAERLSCISEEWSANLTISVYRSASNVRPIVTKIGDALKEIAI